MPLSYRTAGGEKRSPLPDFYIGAHAAVVGHLLLTRDATRYRTSFHKLENLSVHHRFGKTPRLPRGPREPAAPDRQRTSSWMYEASVCINLEGIDTVDDRLRDTSQRERRLTHRAWSDVR